MKEEIKKEDWKEHLPREGSRFRCEESEWDGFCPRCLMTEEEASEKSCFTPKWLETLLLSQRKEIIGKLEEMKLNPNSAWVSHSSTQEERKGEYMGYNQALSEVIDAMREMK